MKTMKFKFLLLLAVVVPLFVACEPTDDETVVVVPKITTGAYILNQGSWGKNNSSLSYYDYSDSTVTKDIFSVVNGRGLGDGGQDAIIYGSNMYVTVTASSLLEVIDPKTGKSKQSNQLVNAEKAPRSPRSIAAFGGKIYITLQDGTVSQIDTTTFLVEKTIPVGPNPEGIVTANNLLYIAISGGYGSKDSTISVVDPISFKELRKIKVVINPTQVVADSQGDIYVISNGNYGAIKPAIQRIEKGTEKVTIIPGFAPSEMTIANDKLYFFSFDADYVNDVSTNRKFIQYDATTEAVINENFIANDPITKMPYCLDVDPTNGDIYIAETDYTNTGKMYIFKKDGSTKTSFNVGVNAFKTVFVTK